MKRTYERLSDSFRAFAATIALKEFHKKPMVLDKAWLSLENSALEDCRQKFEKRATSESNQRSLLSLSDWEAITIQRLRQFWAFSPLQERQSESGNVREFTHKSFFEYFLAESILGLKNPDEASLRLNTRPIQTEPEVLSFLRDAYRTPSEQKRMKDLEEVLWGVIERSKTDSSIAQASANAATILNAMGVSFAGKDLRTRVMD